MRSQPTCQLLRTEFHKGADGVWTSYVYGIYRTPNFDLDAVLPPVLLKALADSLRMGPAEVVLRRSRFLRLLMQKKLEFEAE
eukprot:1790606-Amphidinium_carterae.1